MSAKRKRRSFLDEFLRIKQVDGVYIKDRSKGFVYLHKVITKALAEGKEFKMGDIDFSRFTEDDICDYMSYYQCYLMPNERMCVHLFNQVSSDIHQFPIIKKFRGVS